MAEGTGPHNLPEHPWNGPATGEWSSGLNRLPIGQCGTCRRQELPALKRFRMILRITGAQGASEIAWR